MMQKKEKGEILPIIRDKYNFDIQRMFKTIDPIKGLKGKLNFLKLSKPHIISMQNLLASIQPSTTSSISKYSVQEIQGLRSNTRATKTDYNKTIFQYNVHKHTDPSLVVGTIHEQLPKSQKRLVLTLLKYTDKLTSRELLYLNFRLRERLNYILPNWETLHLNRQSPFRSAFETLPLLEHVENYSKLAGSQKKEVLKELASLLQQEKSASQ